MSGIGERIRECRLAQQRSLSDVAARAEISAATLSRIETDKQGISITLFLLLARILKVSPAELLCEEERSDGDPLVDRLAALKSTERARFWTELANARRDDRSRREAAPNVSAQIEELLAQIDYLRQEVDAVRNRMKKRSARR